MKISKRKLRERRRQRIRVKIRGTRERPRLSIFRSNKHIWMQLIDDTAGKTLVAVSDFDIQVKTAGKKRNTSEGSGVLHAGHAGELLAKRAKEKNIDKIVFDRGGYTYHGIIKAAADGVRKGGLQF